jgi:hypothetical protein
MNDQDLMMKQIIDETYQDDVTSSSPINLVHYFEKRLNEVDFLSLKNYLTNENIQFLPLEFNQSTGCYRLVLDSSIIDFPSNWSIFSDLQSRQLNFVRATNDEDFLCEIFESHFENLKIMVLTNENNETQLIFLKSDDAEKNLDWIKNYFMNKAELTEKKAA